jgi:hypothetical protein
MGLRVVAMSAVRFSWLGDQLFVSCDTDRATSLAVSTISRYCCLSAFN